MKATMVFGVWMLLLGCWISGCDRWAEVASGVYRPMPPTIEQVEMMTREPDRPHRWIVSPGIEALFVDRDHEVAWIIFEDESLQIIPFTAWPREMWPEGCPTNINGTRMEVLDLAVEELELVSMPESETGSMTTTLTIERPILVRDCPPDPVELVLRDGGEFGGGVACVGAKTCLVLEWTLGRLSLIPSMKGYELYSWSGDSADVWRYTLMTGTNRLKTWDEIAAPESTISEDGWVEITVEGEAALKSVLDRLPEGTEVFWMGSQRMVTPDGQNRLPHEEIVREIQSYGQKQGISLRVTD
ncbi:MAG: hypothetical protein ACP5JG_07490 [Anaerolineae bacterium]